MKKAILFDLGQTLVRYYERSEIPRVLEECINSVHDFLRSQGRAAIADNELRRRVERENSEAVDYLVRPLEDRLARIFDLAGTPSSDELIQHACQYFMKPIFKRGQLFDDTLPALVRLKKEKYATALISNTPWGSPAHLWRQELKRLGIAEYLDVVVFCRDVGWRKPAPHIFTYALHQLHVSADQCLFVGDNPVWDVQGPQAVGIQAVLIDRTRTTSDNATISTLEQLNDVLRVV
jgi:putative hydrolase of the HAD superfamily